MILFIALSCPFIWVCVVDELRYLIPRSEQNLLKFVLSNCFPLSEMIVLRMPNRQTMHFHRKAFIFGSVMVVRGSASAYFVK